MPTEAENLATALANYSQQLAELSDPTRRKVSYSIGGRSVQWTEYQRFLLEQMTAIRQQQGQADPGEVVTALD